MLLRSINSAWDLGFHWSGFYLLSLIWRTGALANEHLIIARRGDVYHSSGPPTARDDLSLQDLAQVIKDDPTSWEGPLA